MRMQNFALVFFCLALGAYVMVVAKGFLLPLVVAIVLWHLINTLARSLASIPSFKLPGWIALPFSVTIFLAVLWVVADLIGANFTELSARLPEYEVRINELIQSFYASFDLGTAPSLSALLGYLDMTEMAKSVASSVAGIASQTGLILIYVLFLLIEQSTFKNKLTAILTKSGGDEALQLLARMNRDIETYLRIKVALSILVAGVGYGVLLAVGVDFAFFWAVLFFLFNFIPTVGGPLSLIGPALLSLVQFEGLGPFLVVMGGVGLTQVAVNNLLEPALMGRSLNLSPFAIIVTLVAFGTLWGLVGMFLAVPMMVIAMIVLSHFKSTQKLAILMSASGKLGRSS